MQTRNSYILDLRSLSSIDIPIAGVTNASLGELLNISSCSVRVPAGFAVLVDGYRDLLKTDGLGKRIDAVLSDFRSERKSLEKTGRTIRNMVLDSELPPLLAVEVAYRYAELCGPEFDAPVAVRCSTVTKDLAAASTPGERGTFLNVSGVRAVQRSCVRTYASFFADSAIAYRERQGIDHLESPPSVGIQQMVRSDLGSSGVMSTRDPKTGFDNSIVINSAWGLGDSLVHDSVKPDQFYVSKQGLENPRLNLVVRRVLGEKNSKVVFSDDLEQFVEAIPATAHECRTLSLCDADVLQLARWGLAIERAYGKPVDVEWARDGQSGKLYIVGTRV